MSARRRKAYIRVAQRDLRLASVRYRGLLPGCALQDAGWDVQVGAGVDQPSAGTDLVIAVKPLAERDANWVREVSEAGLPVVVDLCDNVFIDGYANQGKLIGQRFAVTCAAAAVLTVPTPALREIVAQRVGCASNRVLIVPDIVETQSLLERQRELIEGGRRWTDVLVRSFRRSASNQTVPKPDHPVLLWFGNHGASYANFGMHDLLLFREALRQAATCHGAELWVVSNNRERFDQVSSQLPIRSRYFEWTPSIVDELLTVARVCLVPNSLDEFSATKSANRAVKALSAGVPVVATRTSAYTGMEDSMWLGDPVDGIRGYLRGPDLREKHLRSAARVIQARFSMESLRSAMSEVVRTAQAPEKIV